MTQSAESSTSEALRHALTIEAKKLIVNSTYAGQGHLEESSRWSWWDSWLGVPATLGTTLLAAGASVSALLDAQPLVTATIALLATACSTIRVFFKTEDLTQSHGLKGNQYLSLRNEARIFKNLELLSAHNGEELQAHLKDLWQRYNALNELPPLRYSRHSYEAAKRNIAAGEQDYENDPLWKEHGD